MPVRRARGVVSVRSVVPAPPGIVMVSPPEVPRNAESAQCEGRARHVGENRRGQGQYRGRSPVGSGQSADRGSIKAWVLHLEHSEGVLSFARIATTLLHERLPWVTILCCTRQQARERGVHARYALLGTRNAGGGRRPGDRLGAVPVGPPLALAASHGPGLTRERPPRPVNKWRAMGRIEQTLFDEGRGGSAPTDLKTFAR